MSQGFDARGIKPADRRVVSPKNVRTTLGTMIHDLEAAPQKWESALVPIAQLVDRLRAMWVRQPRHRVDDPNDVKDVSREVAEAAVHEAFTIVHLFRNGLIRPAEPS